MEFDFSKILFSYWGHTEYCRNCLYFDGKHCQKDGEDFPVPERYICGRHEPKMKRKSREKRKTSQ